eukprot:Rhum_TRINITY_DN14483_c0_g1::Rhum_TRINITY_DN14483_c0_g1_i1::g.87451::m.87451
MLQLGDELLSGLLLARADAEPVVQQVEDLLTRLLSTSAPGHQRRNLHRRRRQPLRLLPLLLRDLPHRRGVRRRRRGRRGRGGARRGLQGRHGGALRRAGQHVLLRQRLRRHLVHLRQRQRRLLLHGRRALLAALLPRGAGDLLERVEGGLQVLLAAQALVDEALLYDAASELHNVARLLVAVGHRQRLREVLVELGNVDQVQTDEVHGDVLVVPLLVVRKEEARELLDDARTALLAGALQDEQADLNEQNDVQALRLSGVLLLVRHTVAVHEHLAEDVAGEGHGGVLLDQVRHHAQELLDVVVLRALRVRREGRVRQAEHVAAVAGRQVAVVLRGVLLDLLQDLVQALDGTALLRLLLGLTRLHHLRKVLVHRLLCAHEPGLRAQRLGEVLDEVDVHLLVGHQLERHAVRVLPHLVVPLALLQVLGERLVDLVRRLVRRRLLNDAHADLEVLHHDAVEGGRVELRGRLWVEQLELQLQLVVDVQLQHVLAR